MGQEHAAVLKSHGVAVWMHVLEEGLCSLLVSLSNDTCMHCCHSYVTLSFYV